MNTWKWLGHLKVFQQVISKILEKGGIKVPAEDTDACHWVGKQGCVIVKFLGRKDCQQVLSMKKNIQKITATDLDLPNTTIKLYLNDSLYPYYHILWSKRKALLTWIKQIAILFQMGQLKYIYKNRELQFQLHISWFWKVFSWSGLEYSKIH